MIFIKKEEIKFIPAICPKCGGRLELDSSLDVAYCKFCGIQVIIKNAKRKSQNTFDKIINIVERQQEMHRQDVLEREKYEREELKKLNEEDNNKSWFSKYCRIIILFGISITLMIIGYFL